MDTFERSDAASGSKRQIGQFRGQSASQGRYARTLEAGHRAVTAETGTPDGAVVSHTTR